jgi:hypothetical protein
VEGEVPKLSVAVGEAVCVCVLVVVCEAVCEGVPVTAAVPLGEGVAPKERLAVAVGVGVMAAQESNVT